MSGYLFAVIGLILIVAVVIYGRFHVAGTTMGAGRAYVAYQCQGMFGNISFKVHELLRPYGRYVTFNGQLMEVGEFHDEEGRLSFHRSEVDGDKRFEVRRDTGFAIQTDKNGHRLIGSCSQLPVDNN